MTSHISEELPRLLTGEATRGVVQDAAAHLRGCEDCQQELVSAVVAHASLTSAHRFAPDIVERATERPEPVGEEDSELPDLSAVFAQVREETVSTDAKQRSRRPFYAVAAVAAGVLIGGGGAVLIHDVGGSTPSGRSVALSAFDEGTTSAKATLLADDRVTLDATSLPRLDASHRYEVWLTNDARTRMQPVGWIGSNGKAQLTVPADLVRSYRDIEVSVQSLDASNYIYSGTSVLRGSYRA